MEREREGNRQTNATCVEYHLRKMLNTLSENKMERQRKRGGKGKERQVLAEWRGRERGTRLKVKNKSNKKGSKAEGKRRH